ncbi:hypothetical protein J2T56_003001 [Natronobacillus azotifigens]|uniref:Methionyl-tRNA formyltransferase n=1 Tax=Natronobacillus azotifigens TaxID=472978 RepID=A0A9J6RFZ0_9BACI|nr:hypothetical protein [Natronobacillus azotifigens]MCZ0704479.1 hypothetical protein [Natronobacillus azotifigens]
MALIVESKFNRVDKHKKNVHEEVESTYSIFTANSGEKYIQIDTYGKSDREIPGKVSQSIQINKTMAKELLKLIEHEFNL